MNSKSSGWNSHMCSPNMYSIFCFYQGSMSILLYNFKLLKRRRIVAPSLKLHIYYCLIFSNLVKMKIFIFLDLHNNINFHMQVAEHRIWLVRWIELPPTSRVVWRFQFHWNAPPPPSHPRWQYMVKGYLHACYPMIKCNLLKSHDQSLGA